MLHFLAFAILCVTFYAQPDPFAHSDCKCDTFCDYECSINATEAKNMTLYRMTPNGVYDLSDKDTGDVPGDMSFVLSQKSM